MAESRGIAERSLMEQSSRHSTSTSYRPRAAKSLSVPIGFRSHGAPNGHASLGGVPGGPGDLSGSRSRDTPGGHADLSGSRGRGTPGGPADLSGSRSRGVPGGPADLGSHGSFSRGSSSSVAIKSSHSSGLVRSQSYPGSGSIVYHP